MASSGRVYRSVAPDPNPHDMRRCSVCGQWNDLALLNLPDETATVYRRDPDWQTGDGGRFSTSEGGGAFDPGAFDPEAFDVGGQRGLGSASGGIRGFVTVGLGCFFCGTPRVLDGKRGSL